MNCVVRGSLPGGAESIHTMSPERYGQVSRVLPDDEFPNWCAVVGRKVMLGLETEPPGMACIPPSAAVPCSPVFGWIAKGPRNSTGCGVIVTKAKRSPMALTLFFLRHGQAGSRQDWQGDDSQRPLTAEGSKGMAKEAAAIRGLGLSPDRILSSPFVRAYQTAQIVAKAQGAGVDVIRDARLQPGFGPAHLAAILAEHDDTNNIMLVGHEPDFSETISHLTGGRVIMKKGGLACVELEDRASLDGTLLWLIPPRVLRR